MPRPAAPLWPAAARAVAGLMRRAARGRVSRLPLLLRPAAWRQECSRGPSRVARPSVGGATSSSSPRRRRKSSLTPTSAATRTTSAIDASCRTPARDRSRWTTRSIALAGCSRTARVEAQHPPSARGSRSSATRRQRSSHERWSSSRHARVQSLQHVERLGTANLTDHNAVRAHAKRVAHECADRDLPLTFEVRGPAFQASTCCCTSRSSAASSIVITRSSPLSARRARSATSSCLNRCLR